MAFATSKSMEEVSSKIDLKGKNKPKSATKDESTLDPGLSTDKDDDTKLLKDSMVDCGNEDPPEIQEDGGPHGEEINESWFEDYSILNNIRLELNIKFNPVVNLRGKPFRPENINEHIQIKVLKPFHRRSYDTKAEPFFELASRVQAYEEMQQEMIKFYKSLRECLRWAHFPRNCLEKGVIAVFYREGYTSNIFQRMRILGGQYKVNRGKDVRDLRYVRVIPIDGGEIMEIDTKDLLILVEQFAILPPRALDIRLEGLIHYNASRIYRDATSLESGVWEEPLEMVYLSKKSNKVVIYSKVAKESCLSYGVNEFILRRIVAETIEKNRRHLLASEINGTIEDAYVVLVCEETNTVFLQIETPFYSHYEDMMKNSERKISSKLGTVKPPIEVGTMLMAPQSCVYYRAVCTEQCTSDKVQVRFVDFGDSGTVPVSSVVLTDDLHPLIKILPPAGLRVRLFGVEKLNELKFRKVLGANDVVSVRTKKKLHGGLAEVELLQSMWHDDNFIERNINKVYMESFGAKGGILDKMDGFKLVENPTEVPSKEYIHNSIHHDILKSGSGVESKHYKVGTKRMFTICNVGEGKVAIFPSDSVEVVRKLEMELEKTNDFDFKNSRFMHPAGWGRGRCFQVYSNKRKRVVRAIQKNDLVPEKHEMKMFLPDYGDSEVIPYEKVKTIAIKDCRIPACGCEATIYLTNGEELSLESLKKLKELGSFEGKVLEVTLGKSIVPKVKIEINKKVFDKLNAIKLALHDSENQNEKEINAAADKV